ncbi:MAG: hypothetical protein KDE31_20905, partial [Caldilineaceae bacterium]|nr:hypothetical protein [Caldilineaceae bacterium]
PTNLLFFDRRGPTRHIWYYEQPLPEGRKSYTKTQPITVEEFAGLREWWDEREENEQAWRVAVEEVLTYDDAGALVGANLDVKNPNAGEDFEHMPPEALVADIFAKEQRILELITEIQTMLK